MIHGPRQAPPELATELVEAQLRRAQRWSRPSLAPRRRLAHPEWRIVESSAGEFNGRRMRERWLAIGMALLLNVGCLWILAATRLPTSSAIVDDNVHLVVPAASTEVDLSQLAVDIRTPLGDRAEWDRLDQAIGKVTAHPAPLAIPATVEDFFGNPLSIKPTAGGDMVMGGQRGLASRGDGYSGAKINGIRARGERFVFVLDNSLGMAGGAWRQARREVLAGVSRLERTQQFAVILCNGDVYPTPGAAGAIPHSALTEPSHAEQHWHRGDDAATALLAQWLDLQVLVQETAAQQAIETALTYRSDGMYLVGGPSFSPALADSVRRANRWLDEDQIKVPGSVIHTLSVGATLPDSGLDQIAKENGGHFFHVLVP